MKLNKYLYNLFYFRIISTDALARGIDIPDCNYVVSYDPPRNIKTYVHRIGRTGRAGRKGNAVTILVHNQMQMFKVIKLFISITMQLLVKILIFF